LRKIEVLKLSKECMLTRSNYICETP